MRVVRNHPPASMRLASLVALSAILSLAACGGDASGPHPPPPTPPPPPPVMHRIAVRTAGGRGEFYDHTTNALFVPRGANYTTLATQIGWTGNSFVYHSTFNVGAYDTTAVEAMLAQLSRDGFNVVRVFLNGCCEINTIANPAGGLSRPYLANVANFIARAKAHGVWVILTTDDIPMFGGYEEVLYQACCAIFDDGNMNLLTRQGLTVHAKMWHDIIAGLKSLDAPLEAIFAYELVNEQSFDLRYPPLSLTSGTVSTGNGQSYDMSDARSRQAMMDDNLVYWSSHVRDTIVALDPGALVTMGFFVPQGPSPTRIGDYRLTRPYPAVAQSSIDFVDLHAYLGDPLSIDQYAENFGEDAYTAKPVIMGEFGAPTAVYGSASSAADALVAWQVASCQHDFAGWLMWTWDTYNTVDASLWTMTSGDSSIERRLAPVHRPSACTG